MKATVLIATACAALLWFSHARSADVNAAVKDKLSDFSMQLTECYAYYGILAHCTEGVSSAVAAGSNAADKTLLPLIYQTGRMAGLIDSALLGRIQMALDVMNSDIKNDCGNMAALYAKYGQSCKAVVEHPDAQLRKILSP